MSITGNIYDPRKHASERNKWLSYASYCRRYAKARAHLFNPREGLCPGCSTRMHARVLDSSTMFVCPNCSYTHKLPYLINEARLPGEHWSNNVGKHKGTATVKLSIDGKIKGLSGV